MDAYTKIDLRLTWEQTIFSISCPSLYGIYVRKLHSFLVLGCLLSYIRPGSPDMILWVQPAPTTQLYYIRGMIIMNQSAPKDPILPNKLTVSPLPLCTG